MMGRYFLRRKEDVEAVFTRSSSFLRSVARQPKLIKLSVIFNQQREQFPVLRFVRNCKVFQEFLCRQIEQLFLRHTTTVVMPKLRVFRKLIVRQNGKAPCEELGNILTESNLENEELCLLLLPPLLWLMTHRRCGWWWG